MVEAHGSDLQLLDLLRWDVEHAAAHATVAAHAAHATHAASHTLGCAATTTTRAAIARFHAAAAALELRQNRDARERLGQANAQRLVGLVADHDGRLRGVLGNQSHFELTALHGGEHLDHFTGGLISRRASGPGPLGREQHGRNKSRHYYQTQTWQPPRLPIGHHDWGLRKSVSCSSGADAVLSDKVI